ncbi:AMP-dependent synthetase/ligase [Umezawaea beigongshangensis]|uniref:AMP-dependent synthetase/ligase n=1 Tax=Umezawaea beigongshangensis TaxID=2780383 RepID=UPI0027DCBCA4|nr:long-chain fatty acid--CoA ligase [Umezawaea beigongshangensis]
MQPVPTHPESVPATGSAHRADALRVVADLPFLVAGQHGDRVAWRYRHDGEWRDLTFAGVADRVRALAAGLVRSGVRAGDRVCVLAETRREWSLVDLAILVAGAVVVPVYPSSSPDECRWIVADSGAVLVVCEDDAQAAKIESVAADLPELRRIVVIDAGERGLTTVAELGELGRAEPADAELSARRAAVGPDDPTTIVYTSGTTGPPKGCVLTSTNWITLCRLVEELSYTDSDDVVYLFLPLAHVFAQIVQFSTMFVGGTLVFGDPKRVVPDLAEVRPTYLPSVPRIFEKIYTLAAGPVPPDALERAVRLGLEVRRRERAAEPVPPELAEQFAQVDQALFSRVRAVFGGRLRRALSGAAPISTDVLEFFHAAGVPVLEGYGMSESTAVGTFSTLDHFRIGSVGTYGRAGLEVRVADDGEILLRGPHVFAGYWRDPEATAQVLADGWLRTGDLGTVDEDGFVTITGRKKDVIITAGGKNIAPANVENALRRSRWISHAVVFGDRRPYLVALITLDAEEIVPWARERGLPEDVPALAGHPEVRALVQGVVDGANAHFASVSQVKRFHVLDRDLSQADGELTPTSKVKRRVVHTVHEKLYADLYS